jgi:hypothetical protein
VVRKRKVAITGLAIRASCRRFRIAGYGFQHGGINTSPVAYLPGNLTENPCQSKVIIGRARREGNLTVGH